MQGTQRRDRRRTVLRESIVRAARTIVRDDGLAALTMRKIADAIDYAPASLYAHFENREALLAELCREGLVALRLALEEGSSGIRDPRARLTATGLAYVRFARERPDTYRLIFMEDPALTKGVFESLGSDDGDRALSLIADCFTELRIAGTLRKSIDTKQLTDLYWTIVHGVASLRLACPALPATDDARLIAMAVASIVDGSRPRPRRVAQNAVANA